MIKLHGVEVKEGDTVWHYVYGSMTVIRVDNTASRHSILCGGIWHDPAYLLWQPISPEAIEAAKQKPKEPEYEWQWLIYDDRDNTYDVTIHCKNREQAESEITGYKLGSRIEESKREVSHE